VFFVLINCVLFSSAKLGDTKELEDFIADLDRTLASKCCMKDMNLKTTFVFGVK